jgi:hypothetical protein
MSASSSSVDISSQNFDNNMQFFWKKTYTCKEDIIRAVDQYSQDTNHLYKVTKSDSKRYYVQCTKLECSFKVHFNFQQSFKAPDSYVPHNCMEQLQDSVLPKVLARREDIVEWAYGAERTLSTKGLNQFLKSKGIQLQYKHLYSTYQKLKKRLFISDTKQYQMLKSYTETLQKNENYVYLEHTENQEFKRIAVLYLQGLQAFRVYKDRGLQLDATFVKNSIGGTLLVSCFKDGNNNILIIGVAIVSSETEDNWRWFQDHLKNHLEVIPGFIISDRNQGLLNAATMFKNVPHFYCFRHLLENFSRRFKNKQLKNLAWGLAKASTIREFEKNY